MIHFDDTSITHRTVMCTRWFESLTTLAELYFFLFARLLRCNITSSNCFLVLLFLFFNLLLCIFTNIVKIFFYIMLIIWCFYYYL